MTLSAMLPTTTTFSMAPHILYVSSARMMTGTPSTSKHTLCLSLVPMRVPLPPARMIVTNGLFISALTPTSAQSLGHALGIGKTRSVLRAW